MGEYADMTIERDLYNHSMGYDNDDYDYLDGYTNYSSSKHDQEIPITEFDEGEDVLVRQYYSNTDELSVNAVCIIVRKTEKAILFRFDKDEGLLSDREFWMPKSVLYMKPNELKVYYIKHWADIKFVN